LGGIAFRDNHQKHAGNTDEKLCPESGRPSVGLAFEPYDAAKEGAEQKPHYDFIWSKHIPL
jgi:hypothetical protein